MWIELEIMNKDTSINWKELGFDMKYEFSRRLIRLHEIYQLQELLPEIQVIIFQDQTGAYVRGAYEDLRDTILHLQNDIDNID